MGTKNLKGQCPRCGSSRVFQMWKGVTFLVGPSAGTLVWSLLERNGWQCRDCNKVICQHYMCG
ncbi:MAG: hypothetical protein FH756_07925 [Firmicutes bacterium]|nr:hypothetical protein [Bacillota bacterium]